MKNQKELFENLNSLSTLPQIQDYISKVLELRGFSNQTVQDKLLLLIEEVGELAKSVRKFSSGASVDERKLSNYSNVESELAERHRLFGSFIAKTSVLSYFFLLLCHGYFAM